MLVQSDTYFCSLKSAAPVYKGDQMLFSMRNLAELYTKFFMCFNNINICSFTPNAYDF